MAINKDILPTLEEAKKLLINVAGSDCYESGVLFPGGEAEREALKWLSNSMKSLVERGRPNAEKANRVITILARVVLHGYIDHMLMHKFRNVEDDNKKLKETVDHLATKLAEK